MMNKNKQIYIILILTALFSLHVGEVQGQAAAVGHQVGEFYKDRLPNGMQKTNTHRTTIYIKPGETKTLRIPTDGGAAPHSYSRWYDYSKNTKSTFLSFNNNNGSYPNGRFTYNGVTGTASYNAPKEGVQDNEAVAVDVSAYKDWTTSGSNITMEPTLSYRWIFDMKDANQIAKTLKDLTANGQYLEDKTIDLPVTKLTNAKDNPRVTLEYSQNNYYGYKANEESNKNLEVGTLKVYGDGREDNGVTLQNRFITIDQTKRIKEITVKLSCGNKTYNVARFKLNYVENPVTFDELEKNGAYRHRKLFYLKENYVELSTLNFDYDTNPATKENNSWLMPLEWDYCSYGFASASLWIKKKRDMPDGCAASQNEYGLYKSAQITGISSGTINNVVISDPKGNSQSGSYKYNWWNGSESVRDRRYYETGGREAGYFMYIDASDQPGVVAKLKFSGDFCSGTKLIVSAAICNMSNGTDSSDADLNFVFKGVDASTQKEYVLHRYTSGDIPKYSGGAGKDEPWYQAYYSFSYDEPQDGVTYDNFLLQVENNALTTTGGDYAIDDIRVYRSKPTVQANQIQMPCGINEEAKIKIRIGYEKLIKDVVDAGSSEEDIAIRYQFMDVDKKAIPGYNYNEGNGEAFYDYGTVWIKTERDAMESWEESNGFDNLPLANGGKVFAKIEYVENDPQGQYYYVVFRSPNNKVLKYDYEYHTAVANRGGTFETGVCSLISDVFTIKKPSLITVNGQPLIDGKGICYGSPMTLGAVLIDLINHEPIKEDYRFDWFFGADYYGAISEALGRYRKEYPKPTVADGTTLKGSKGDFVQSDYDLLKEAIDGHKLILNQKEVVRRVMKGEIILAKPIAGSIEESDINIEICNDEILLDTSGESAMPDIEIGKGFQPKGIRIDIEQLAALQSNQNNQLWIPVSSFTNSDNSRSYKIVQSNDENNLNDQGWGIVSLKGTDDPVYADQDFAAEDLLPFASLKTIEVGPGIGEEYIVFTFLNGLSMKEGYTYQLMFFFNEENGVDQDILYSVCNGMCIIEIKVVPKYLTWTGVAGDNWNNDRNWRRSTKDELYKGAGDTYDETSADNKLGFVPMHTTRASIPDVVTAPWLYDLRQKDGVDNIEANLNHPAVSANDSVDYKANAPSPDIQYELEAWTGSEVGKGEFEYACKQFSGNTCKDIYFKPKAEVRNTNYLRYSKAWVDFELKNNRWYMLASPLQGVVAGDMYLPTQGGRQITEAFKDITYQQGAINNRFAPAVYQRNWSKDGAQNFRPNVGDYLVNKVGDWSGAYNKVNQEYKEGEGFSIRPIYFKSQNIEEGHTVLFRLPKADTSYDYYAYGNDEILDEGKKWNSGGRPTNGRLALTPENDEIVTMLENNHDGGGEIFLAGNPFMATLDMNRFFDAHQSDSDQTQKLEREYSLLTSQGQCQFIWNNTSSEWDSSMKGITGGTVAPLQGFFVRRAVPGGKVTVAYKPEMTIAKPQDSSIYSTRTRATDNTPHLYVSAERNGWQSHILIAQQPGADDGYNNLEDAATIMDSNLKEAPTLYSVAGNTVVSINRISDQKLIPLGIYSEKQEEVTLTFSGVETFGKEIELYDAELKTRTVLTENATVTVPGNTHGRYFISLERDMDGEQADGGITAYSPEANKIIVSASLSNKLKSIQVYNVSGMMVRSLTQLDSVTEELDLPGGMYIVRAQSQTENSTVKVIVKGK